MTSASNVSNFDTYLLTIFENTSKMRASINVWE